MYFSLIMPEQGYEREAAHERLDGPYMEHQWLWNFFPAPAGTQRDFLFRRIDGDGFPRFYVVSSRRPQPPGNAWRVQTREYAPKLHHGARLRFDLRANPVLSRRQDGKVTRHDVVMEEKKRLLQERGLAQWQDWQGDDKPPQYELVQRCCTGWLKMRAPQLGFEFDESLLAADTYQQHRQKKYGGLRFSTVDFSGELTVTDPLQFRVALETGIGHAKAFGCGLLLVRPAE